MGRWAGRGEKPGARGKELQGGPLDGRGWKARNEGRQGGQWGREGWEAGQGYCRLRMRSCLDQSTNGQLNNQVCTWCSCQSSWNSCRAYSTTSLGKPDPYLTGAHAPQVVAAGQHCCVFARGRAPRDPRSMFLQY